MITIERWFEALLPAAEHVIIFAFEASLPFAERRVLERMHRGGVRHITLLVDSTDYAASFADLAATRHAGVSYTVHRVRLDGRFAAFHPKLYLAMWADRARLLVSSANLTPTGFRSNLEIADELSLHAGQPSDVAAFQSYADLLDELPRIDPTLDQRIAERLRKAAAAIKALAARCRERESPVYLLHSARRSLLSQVRDRIPDERIEHITIVSPFFDQRSRGLLAIVRAFDAGAPLRVRVVKDGRAARELDGVALRALGESISVERLNGVTAEPGIVRALHAKLFVLEGARRAWMITGSANATAAAWGDPVPEGGNVEAVTLRELPIAKSRQLLAELVTTPIEHRDLVRDERLDEPKPVEGFALRRAVVVGEAVEIIGNDGPWFASPERVDVRLVSKEGSALLRADVRPRTDNSVAVRSRAGDDALHSAAAVAVTLEIESAQGRRFVSEPVWLDKPLYQELDPSLRPGIRALNQLGDQAFVDGADPLHDAAAFLASLTVRLASEMALLKSSDAAVGSSVAEEPGPDDEDAWDEELSIDGDDEAGDRSGFETPDLPGGATVRRLGGANLDSQVQMAQRLFDGLLAVGLDDVEDEENENAAARRRIRRLARTSKTKEGAERADGPPERTMLSPAGRQLLALGLDSLQESLNRILRITWSVDRVPQLAGTVDALLAALLRFMQHLQRWDERLRTRCAIITQDAWARVWSVEGWLYGHSRGLYVRALEHPDLGPAIRDFYSDPERLARVAAMAAMAAALSRTTVEGAAVPAGVLAGMALVTGGASLAVGPISDRISDHASAFVRNETTVRTEVLLNALVPSPFEESSDGRLVQVWLPVIRIEQARTSIGDAAISLLETLPPQVPNTIVSRYRQLVRARRPLRSVSSREGDLLCAACENTLPRGWGSDIRRPDAMISCESCGATLAPLAWHDIRVLSMLARLERLLGHASESPHFKAPAVAVEA